MDKRELAHHINGYVFGDVPLPASVASAAAAMPGVASRLVTIKGIVAGVTWDLPMILDALAHVINDLLPVINGGTNAP